MTTQLFIQITIILLIILLALLILIIAFYFKRSDLDPIRSLKPFTDDKRIIDDINKHKRDKNDMLYG